MVGFVMEVSCFGQRLCRDFLKKTCILFFVTIVVSDLSRQVGLIEHFVQVSCYITLKLIELSKFLSFLLVMIVKWSLSSGSNILFSMDTPTTPARTASYHSELEYIWEKLNDEIRKPGNKVVFSDLICLPLFAFNCSRFNFSKSNFPLNVKGNP